MLDRRWLRIIAFIEFMVLILQTMDTIGILIEILREGRERETG